MLIGDWSSDVCSSVLAADRNRFSAVLHREAFGDRERETENRMNEGTALNYAMLWIIAIHDAINRCQKGIAVALAISDIGGCCVTGRPLHPRLGIGVRAHPFRHRAGPCPCYLLIKAVLRCQTAQRRRHSGGIVTRTRKILDSKAVRLCFLDSGITERTENGRA